MGRWNDGLVLRDLRAVLDGGSVLGESDGRLLERFTARGDESAFAALVERHGAMVWRVCLAGLRDEHAAEDAFQAVFLVLARKARTLRVRDTLGPWLYEVALRTAAFARSEARRRADLERRWAATAVPRLEAPPRDDPAAVIHEELGKIPGRYRAAVLLCDLEGLSHEEAARRLGWPIGTVKSRQSRGRDRLRRRLIRRGFGPNAVMPTFAASPLPRLLAPTTVEVATLLLHNGGKPPMVPAIVLMKGVLSAMRLQMLRTLAAAALMPVALASLASVSGHAAAQPGGPSEKSAVRPIREVLRDAAAAVRPEAVGLLADFALAQARVGDDEGARGTARRASVSAEAWRELDPQREAALLLAVAWARHAGGESREGLKELDRFL